MKPIDLDQKICRPGIVNFRLAGLLLTTLACGFLCAPALSALLHSAGRSEYYSHILLIPIISAYLLFTRREPILREAQYSAKSGMATAAAGLLCYGVALAGRDRLTLNDHTSLVMMATITIWAGGFIALYGTSSTKQVFFPIAFLLFMVPLPDRVMEAAIQFLRSGSTEAANFIFSLSGVPFERVGYSFNFSTLSVFVADECSGIRSFIALVITGVLAGNMFLRRNWSRLLLVLSLAPIAMFKNGIRIATLALMGNYVDQRVLDSDLHRKGGVLFFLIAIFLLFTFTFVLKKIEEGKFTMGQSGPRTP